MTQVYSKKFDCYGCGACENICPKSAITMRPDEQGFVYPIVDTEKCVDCGLCQKACQIGKEASFQSVKVEQCIGIKGNDEIRKASSSGGVYTLLSDAVLNMGKDNCCVGVQFGWGMKVEHAHGYTFEERDRFRGSKYVQSHIGKEYSVIADDLKRGGGVLFAGTPCQVSGLKCFLQAKCVPTDRLYLIDVVCHGAPSPRVWDAYVRFLERKYHAKLIDYSFRDKSSGWRGYHIRAEFDNGKTVYDNHITKSFANLFSKDLMIRPSCFFCPYASMCRSGDVTIGDFWGIEKISPSYSDNKEISMVFLNTKKGADLLETARIGAKFEEEVFDANQLTQSNLFGPTNFGEGYDDFWRVFLGKGYEAAAKKWGGYGTFRKLYHYRNAVIYRLRKI